MTFLVSGMKTRVLSPANMGKQSCVTCSLTSNESNDPIRVQMKLHRNESSHEENTRETKSTEILFRVRGLQVFI